MTAAAKAEKRYNIPPSLLAAIGEVESGRPDPLSGRTTPWPWTIDSAGYGAFFPDAKSAAQRLEVLQSQGVAPIDVGCFQVDLTYHPDAFATPAAAFDPDTNADVAARFLSSLYGRLGSWPAAVAAYHSATPLLGIPYRNRVLSFWHAPDNPNAPEALVHLYGVTIWTPQSQATDGNRPIGTGLPHIIVPAAAAFGG